MLEEHEQFRAQIGLQTKVALRTPLQQHSQPLEEDSILANLSEQPVFGELIEAEGDKSAGVQQEQEGEASAGLAEAATAVQHAGAVPVMSLGLTERDFALLE
eukprot:m.71701 g.71701  ORF g.71701 m.71701 type:complete len:102 (+) comp50199_c0_seq4:296-601(+)